MVDRILVVDYPVDTQIVHVTVRNGLPHTQVEVITIRQASREAHLAAANDVIDNSGALADFLLQIDHLDPTYRSN